MFQRDSDPYRAAKYIMEFLQNKIVKVLDNWAKCQTWVMFGENLYRSLKMVFEILLIQLDWAWVNLWEELQGIQKYSCAK